MKPNKLILIPALLFSLAFVNESCKKNSTSSAGTTVYYQQADQVGRPAINTVFNVAADKDSFNEIAPSAMSAVFQPKFLTNLVALDGALHAGNPSYVQYSTDVLGLSAAQLTGALSTDVLNVATKGTTSFFTSTTNYFKGRKLSDDVIDDELTVIFGGTSGSSNPTLTSDGVSANDKVFLTSFPYEAAPW